MQRPIRKIQLHFRLLLYGSWKRGDKDTNKGLPKLYAARQGLSLVSADFFL